MYGMYQYINFDTRLLFVVAMSWLLPDRGVALIKKELRYLGPFGLSAYLCGSIFIDRSNPEKARKTMDKAVQEIQNKNVSWVCTAILDFQFVFPPSFGGVYPLLWWCTFQSSAHVISM